MRRRLLLSCFIAEAQVVGSSDALKSFIKSSLSAVKGARDEQSNDRQRQTEDN